MMISYLRKRWKRCCCCCCCWLNKGARWQRLCYATRWMRVCSLDRNASVHCATFERVRQVNWVNVVVHLYACVCVAARCESAEWHTWRLVQTHYYDWFMLDFVRFACVRCLNLIIIEANYFWLHERWNSKLMAKYMRKNDEIKFY